MSAIGIEALVCEDIAKRQAFGIKKYGHTGAEDPGAETDPTYWLNHAYQEALDLAIYLRTEVERIKNLPASRAENQLKAALTREAGLRTALIDAKGFIAANTKKPVHDRIKAYNSALDQQ